MKVAIYLDESQLTLLIDVINNRVEGGDAAFEEVVRVLELARTAGQRVAAEFVTGRMRLADTISRPLGCRCHREVGDSDCPVHPSEDEAMLQRALGVGPVPSIRADESGATGAQRSDWGERGEGSEEP